jgi:hypothetical protein
LVRQYWAPDPADLLNEDDDHEEQDEVYEERDQDHLDQGQDHQDDHHEDEDEDRNRDHRGFEQLVFGTFDPRLAVLQPHIALARKRVNPSWLDSEQRALLVEEAAGTVMGSRIALPGHEITTLQLREGYVVYADAPAAPQAEP